MAHNMTANRLCAAGLNLDPNKSAYSTKITFIDDYFGVIYSDLLYMCLYTHHVCIHSCYLKELRVPSLSSTSKFVSHTQPSHSFCQASSSLSNPTRTHAHACSLPDALFFTR